MIDSQIVKDAIERNKEILTALEARRGPAQAALIMKAAQAMVLSRIAVPPAEHYKNPMVHKIATRLQEEAQSAWMMLAVRAFIPNFEEISEEEASKLSDEFFSELTVVGQSLTKTLDTGLREDMKRSRS